ncbi:MAG: hypothetical protein ACI4S2_06720 [Lachnospiraceae bacterium]
MLILSYQYVTSSLDGKGMDVMGKHQILELAISVRDYQDMAEKAEEISVFMNNLARAAARFEEFIEDEQKRDVFSSFIGDVLDAAAEFVEIPSWDDVWHRIDLEVFGEQAGLELKKQFYLGLSYEAQIKIYNQWRKNILGRFYNLLSYLADLDDGIVTSDAFEILDDAISFFETFAFIENYWINDFPVYNLPSVKDYGLTVINQLNLPENVYREAQFFWNK